MYSLGFKPLAICYVKRISEQSNRLYTYETVTRLVDLNYYYFLLTLRPDLFFIVRGILRRIRMGVSVDECMTYKLYRFKFHILQWPNKSIARRRIS